ncbi:MAG: hypothetical protein R3C20_09610 [Planctomycetaceae bacterium]
MTSFRSQPGQLKRFPAEAVAGIPVDATVSVSGQPQLTTQCTRVLVRAEAEINLAYGHPEIAVVVFTELCRVGRGLNLSAGMFEALAEFVRWRMVGRLGKLKELLDWSLGGSRESCCA